MTGDEIERAIEFLIESQARHDARMADIDHRLGRVSEQTAQLSERLAQLSEQTSQLSEQTSQLSEQTSQLSEHLAQIDMVVREYTGMQSELVRVVTRTFEAQAKINDEFRAEMRDGRDEFRAELRATHETFRESFDRLAALVERHVSDGHGGGA